MKLEITQELVEKIIAEKVEEAIGGRSIEQAVKYAIDYEIRKKIDLMIEREVGERAKMLTSETVNALLDQPTCIDDGWGRRERYETLGDYYRSVLKEHLTSNRVEREVRVVVKKRVDDEIRAKSERISEIIAAEIEMGAEDE